MSEENGLEKDFVSFQFYTITREEMRIVDPIFAGVGDVWRTLITNVVCIH